MPPKVEESEKIWQQLEVKAKVFNNLKGKISGALTEGNIRNINRLKQRLQEKVEDCFKLISSITKLKIAEGKTMITKNVWRSQQQDHLKV